MSPIETLTGQASSGSRVGLAAGIEFHGPWIASRVGPTASVSASTRLTNRIQIQGVLAGSARVESGGDDVTICPPSGCVADRTDPAATLAASAELVLYDHSDESGGYVLGGLGLIRYSGRALQNAPVRSQVGVGIGGATGSGRSQLFVEARLAYVINAGPYPKWFAPFRAGWRTRI